MSGVGVTGVVPHMGDTTRRTFMGAGILASGGLIATGVGMMTGVLDPSAPWLGIPALWDDPAEQLENLDPADVETDGVTIPMVDLHGRSVAPEEGDELPTADETAQMMIGDLHGEANPDWFDLDDSRLRIPSVGMNSPLLAMSAVNGNATPPGFRACYVLRNFGTGLQDPTKGSLIVLCHSAVYRSGPGNFLIDTSTGDNKVPAGAGIFFAEQPYIFESSEQVRKRDLPDHDRVWENRPGDLVIITCRQVGGARTTHNSVLFATAYATAPPRSEHRHGR